MCSTEIFYTSSTNTCPLGLYQPVRFHKNTSFNWSVGIFSEKVSIFVGIIIFYLIGFGLLGADSCNF